MTLNLVKLCVGASSIDDLERWQAMPRNKKTLQGQRVAFHTTFQKPTREAELLDGGSLYWVIKGTILVRQPIAGFGEGQKDDGSPCCLILLDPTLIPVRPVPRRPFQGWRYLSAADAPPDAKPGSVDEIAAMPPKMRKSLADLGLI
ncbi:MAG TPA: DUF1489 domain-containing protein [Hyphomicrobium sp.]|nr:DUF1489 domain-containing protein [Hyphomicrobium sp.]